MFHENLDKYFLRNFKGKFSMTITNSDWNAGPEYTLRQFAEIQLTNTNDDVYC